MRYVAANREEINARRRVKRAAAVEPSSGYLRKFGIDKAEYDRLCVQQKGVCAICARPDKGRRLAVDHCHNTGRIRGLLCGLCNTAIGRFDDDPRLLQLAIDYLRSDCG